ncbi:MAG: alpha-ketoglutarate-dependent dioxygenase AlkB [Bacteroidota bacterium]
MYDLSLFSSEEDTAPIQLPLEDGEVIYYPRFFKTAYASEVFQKLYHETPWQEDDIKLFGKVYKQPRLTALHGEDGKSYSYSGITMYPRKFTPLLQTLKEKVETTTHHMFTTVLLNLYRDGNDSNGWHSDDEKELGNNPVIASVSLGAKRYFQLKHKEHKSTYKLLLEHGSLLLMKGSTQHFWLHQLPKSKKVTEPRINLTFRTIL